MATRSISTYQPAVACAVCGRNLLRGEQADLFIAAGEPRTVCELCAGRARHAGWRLHRDDEGSARARGARGRGARSLIERLRARRQPVDASEMPPDPQWDETPSPAYEPAVPAHAASDVARAIEIFNAGPEPRRVAGIGRSLGAPTVAVRSLAGAGTVVGIVVAWELCWYRYEVDLRDDSAGTRLIAEGSELGELRDFERVTNATADELGELSMLAA